MRSFIVPIGVLLLAVSQVGGFGGCGCRQGSSASYESPPCESQEASSCPEPKGCPPCETDVVPEPCPECPAPVQPECPACPAPQRPPPCQVCRPPKECEVCKKCPAPVAPEPCPTCPPPPPPRKCPACPARKAVVQPQCPPSQPQPQAQPQPQPSQCGPAPRARPLARRPNYGNDCCNQCGNSCFVRRRLRAHGATTLVVDIDPTCNSEKLRAIILNNIAGTTSDSKRAIQKEANEKLSAHYDVVCAKGEFAYVVSSNQFCQDTKDDITCYAFRRS